MLRLAAALILAFLACTCLMRGTRAAAAEPGAAALAEAVLEVAVKGGGAAETMVVLRAADGTLYLEEDDFGKLRLHLPQTPPTLHEGHRYYAPTAIRGCTVSIDEGHQRATLSVPAGALDTTRLTAAEQRHPPVTPASPGGFLNYQASAQQIAGVTSGGLYGEFGVFAGPGVLTSSAIARDGGGANQLIRLDTTFTRDFPDQLETLNAGDGISDPGTWGDAVRFAGVRFARNFALRPDLLTTPLLATAGTATVPSTVDVFVNNRLVSSNQVPAGPFIIDQLPSVTGSGDVNVVVRDALGREQVVSQPFYTSSTLLARGLTQYSVDFGEVRDDYGVASDHYGPLLGEASYRRGITDAITVEGHGEYLRGNAHAAGVNAVLGVSSWGTVNITAANGGATGGSGWLSGAGLEHHGQQVSFLASTSWATREFAQVGGPTDASLRIRQRSLVQGGVALGAFGSLSMAYVLQTYQDSPQQQTLTVSHTLNVGHAGTLNLSVARVRTAADVGTPAADSTSVYLVFVHSIGDRSAASVSGVAGSGGGVPGNEIIASLSQSPPAGAGSGYRLSASTTGNYDADWRQQFGGGDVEAEVARNQGVAGQSLLATGALTFLDGQVHTTRAVNGSFATVDVGGLPDVPVFVENQLIAHTDASGRALLYNLRAYEANHISIDAEDLPLDTTIGATQAVLAPPFRSGVVARFPVQRVQGATFRLVTADGRPVPVGAIVTLKGAEFPVVLNGVVYVTGYDHGMGATATWQGGQCRFRLEPPPDEPLPDLGTIRCRR